jgi:hypothetical protein
MTISISEVIEQCAKVCADSESGLWSEYENGGNGRGRASQYIEGAADVAGALAAAIRALKAQYEGCIVAEGDPDCWISTDTGEPHWSDGKNRFPLYRARETQR